MPYPASGRVILGVASDGTATGVFPAGGGGVEYFDPTGQISNSFDWYNPPGDYTTTTNLHVYLDDGVRSPTAPTTGTDGIWNDGADTTLTLSCAEPTAAVTSVKVWAYASIDAGTNTTLGVNISRDGSTWVGLQSLGTITTTASWHSYEYTSLGWATPTDFRIILDVAGATGPYRVYGLYAEVTYA